MTSEGTFLIPTPTKTKSVRGFRLNGFGFDPQVTDTGIVRCAPAPIRQIGAGDDAANITGATLSVHGGWSAV